MRNLNIKWFFIVLAFVVSCTSNSKETAIAHKIDTAKAIEEAVIFLFKTERFAPEFYSDTLKIVKSKNVSANTRFMLNGKMSKQVNERPRLQVLNDWNHPKLYLEVMELKRINKNTIFLDMFFRTTGNGFNIWIKEKKPNSLSIDSTNNYQN
jgi:hypothetical protein